MRPSSALPLALAAFLSLSLAPRASQAEEAKPAAAMAADGVIVVHVVVPLCDNAQIDCGSTRAGAPADLEHNLYWGAVFGHKRHFSRKASAFRLVSTSRDVPGVLERVVFRRETAGKPFGRDSPVGVVLVLDAVHGERIDAAVDAAYRAAERGERVTFREGEADQTLKVDVIGFAGHNRMMDGKEPPPALDKKDETVMPIPSFVLACRSRAYWQEPLEARGSVPLVLTRDLVAPEGYVLEALVDGLARNEARPAIRKRVVAAYAKWQRIEEKVAGGIFARLD